MAGVKSKASGWCPVRSSKKIQTLVKYKMETKGWGLTELARESGIDKPRLSNYFNNKPRGVTNIQLYHIAELLGFDIEITVRIK